VISAQNNPVVRNGLLSLAALAVIGGGAIAYISSSFTIRTSGMLLLLIGVALGRIARSREPINQLAARAAASTRPGPIPWIVAIVLALATVISFYYLYEDALHGYQQVLPVYAFAAITLICGLVWAALLARLVQ